MKLTRERIAHARAKLAAAGVLAWSEAFCLRERATLDEVLGDRHFPRVARARHAFWSVLRDTLVLSIGDLADMLAVERSSVAHALRRRQRNLRAEHAGRAA